MRLASVLALSAAAATVVALASPAEAQRRRVYRDQTERITIIDENGRARTKITVRPRSYPRRRHRGAPGRAQVHRLRAAADLHERLAPTRSWDPTGTHRFPLPMPFELPGYNRRIRI